MNVTTALTNATSKATTIPMFCKNINMMIVGASIAAAASVAAIVGVGIGLYLCKRSLRSVGKK